MRYGKYESWSRSAFHEYSTRVLHHRLCLVHPQFIESSKCHYGAYFIKTGFGTKVWNARSDQTKFTRCLYFSLFHWLHHRGQGIPAYRPIGHVECGSTHDSKCSGWYVSRSIMLMGESCDADRIMTVSVHLGRNDDEHTDTTLSNKNPCFEAILAK